MLTKNSLVIYRNFPAVIESVSADKYGISFCPNLQPKPGKGYPLQSQNVREKDIILLSDKLVTSLTAVCDRANNTSLCDNIASELAELWELFRSDEETANKIMTFSEITEMMSSVGNDDLWAIYQTLCNDIHYEHTAETTFCCRDEQKISELKAEQDKAAQEAADKEAFMERLKAKSLILPDDAKYMHEVEAVAFGKSDKSRIMKDLGLKELPETAHKLLLDTGVWTAARNPYPARYNLSLKVSDVPLLPPSKQNRQVIDHTAFAIDSIYSDDPDDAIFYDGEYLWVHVADPAENVTPDSDADKQACGRGATLYLPEQVIRMLPLSSVSDYGLGLCGDNYSKALTFRIKLDDNMNVTDVDVMPTLVHVKRLTYEEADSQSDSAELASLYTLADKIAARRAANGAAFIDMPEIHMSVDITGDEPVVTIDEDLKASQATKVVRECMVIAGEAAALFALRNSIPFPFISQPDPELKEDIPMKDGQPDGLAGNYQTRRCMKGRIVGVTPAHHAGMGLDIYCQVTSPLRRYIDLVAHQQLRLFLSGQTPMDKDTLLQKISTADIGAAACGKAERESKLHWICVYIMQHTEECYSGVLVDWKAGKGIVNIAKFGTEFPVTLPRTTPLNSAVNLKAKNVNLPEQAVTWEVV